MTEPTEAIKAADAFEHWLQGRINLCITGLQSQIIALQNQMQSHLEELTKQRGEAIPATALEMLVNNAVDDKLESLDIHHTLDSYKLWDIIEHDVRGAIGDKVDAVVEEYLDNNLKDKVESAVEDADFDASFEEYLDDNLKDKVTSIVMDMTFDVSVSS